MSPPRRPTIGGDAAFDDLRSTSESICVDVRRLERIEEQKLTLGRGDEALAQLSTDAVELAERIERQARAERQIVHEID